MKFTEQDEIEASIKYSRCERCGNAYASSILPACPICLGRIKARALAASKASGVTLNAQGDLRDPKQIEAFDRHSIEDCLWLIRHLERD